MNQTIAEDFQAVHKLYEEQMSHNASVHALIYPEAYGEGEYIGQFSDNTASELLNMARAMGLPAGARVLDAGCGRGNVAVFLARSLGWHVTGIDISETSLAAARQTAEKAGIQDACRFVHANLYEHPFAEPFDGVYGTGSFCHFDAAHLFPRLASLLRPGGVLGFMERVRVSEMPIPAESWEQLTRSWYCPSVYSAEEYRGLLADAGFGGVEITDLTDSFCRLQTRFVQVRAKRRADIISVASADYFQESPELAGFETNAAAAGWLGYVQVIACRS